MKELGRGTTLRDGRYRLRRLLARGGMAAVWLAGDVALEREVAVKVVDERLAGDEEYLTRFLREARVAAGLTHAGLVRLYDYDVEDGVPYLVMEYLPGGTLAQRRDRGEPVDAEDLARDLLGALAVVHEAGVVHRDVKPQNVLFGADGRARLTDFGIARPGDATTLTGTGLVIGTMRYLAPEVAEGHPATPASDLFSLGLVLRQWLPAGPSPLAALTERLADPDPARRPASASDALAALDAPPPAPGAAGVGPAPRPRRAGRDHPRDPASAGARAATRIVTARPRALAVALLTGLAVAALLALAGAEDGDRRARGDDPAGAEQRLDRDLAALEEAVREAVRRR